MPNDSIVFVDTNVLLYADDAAFPAKSERAREWLAALWMRRSGRLSTQVLNEYYANATRKLRPPMKQGDARAEVRRYQHWKPWAIDHQTVETAWAMEARFQLSWWDALIVASAIHQGCRYLLTEDLQHGQQIDSVQILNPFLVGPAVLDEPALKA
ncbi:PIN domain-containing protein [Ideonella sp. 4Y11]|uniref:PIN domain-containing protein n=1 Tax=Ideonella aquatica TaxID=2824119 RepID=A0A940YHB0_9BURK|nr:PIN domain-containing protein [Ideonella aquatica]MBQ0958131.1 PIN domain-containing protein [Ideonella aquatica]